MATTASSSKSTATSREKRGDRRLPALRGDLLIWRPADRAFPGRLHRPSRGAALDDPSTSYQYSGWVTRQPEVDRPESPPPPRRNPQTHPSPLPPTPPHF